MSDFSTNPKITFAECKLQDLLEYQAINPDSDYVHITSHRDETVSKYQLIFAPKHIPFLSKDEFSDFLLYRNNHHWDSLHRVGSYMVEDMDLLKEALTILLDETITIDDRINQLRP